jgi:capsular exopolysaccharide synthesis family protein
VKTPEEVVRELGIASLGLIPMTPGVAGRANPLISEGVPPSFSEAFRALRTNILFSAADGGPRSIVVTSTGPSEGKTMVAGNVAIGLAQTGQKVLLIDADMRRPRAHELFGIPVEPGLSNLLVAASKASDVVQPSGVENLWIIPAGTAPPNPAELLGSRRFADLTHSLQEHFDCVIIDTPPVLAVTDAAVVAHRASGVLFVIAADSTSRQAAQTALDQLEHSRAKFLGAVLNRVDVERDSYYYSRYYRKDYANYYSASPARSAGRPRSGRGCARKRVRELLGSDPAQAARAGRGLPCVQTVRARSHDAVHRILRRARGTARPLCSLRGAVGRSRRPRLSCRLACLA